MTRTQTSKLQQNFKGGPRSLFNENAEDTTTAHDSSHNVFMQHENRLANTFNRGQ